MRRFRRWAFAGLLVSLAALVALQLLAPLFETVTLNQGRLEGMTPPQTVAANGAEFASVHIRLNFRASKAKSYADIFQTAAVNEGVRAEIAPSGLLAVVFHADGGTGFRAYVVTPNAVDGAWHGLSVDATPGRLRFWYDGKEVTNDDPVLDPTVSEVAIGSGFSGQRPFAGTLRDAQLRYRLYRTWPQGSELLKVLELLLLVLTAGAIVYLSSNESADSDEY